MSVNFLPENFQFSQSNLQAYERCPRQFFLRYVQGLQWPASISLEANKWEEEIHRGQRFHTWVQQQAIGLDVGKEIASCEDVLLQTWWHNYITKPPSELSVGQVFSEVAISVPLPPFRLVARFDRIIIADNGRAVIVDWKTGQSRPRQEHFDQCWQTVVYQYVLAEAADVFTGGPIIGAEAISLVYWHAGYPRALEPINYSVAKHLQASKRIAAVIKKISNLAGADFKKTEDKEECKRCEFSAYCGRGQATGPDIDIEEYMWQEDFLMGEQF